VKRRAMQEQVKQQQAGELAAKEVAEKEAEAQREADVQLRIQAAVAAAVAAVQMEADTMLNEELSKAKREQEDVVQSAALSKEMESKNAELVVMRERVTHLELCLAESRKAEEELREFKAEAEFLQSQLDILDFKDDRNENVKDELKAMLYEWRHLGEKHFPGKLVHKSTGGSTWTRW